MGISATEPNITVELEANPDPDIVSGKPLPPAVTLAGLSALIVGCVLAWVTVSGTMEDVPPPA